MATDEIKHIVSIEADLAKIQTQIKTLEGDFTKGFKGIEAAALGIGRVLGVAFSATAIIGYGKSVIDLAGHLDDLEKQTGISAQLLSGLKSTLEQNGTTVDAFAKGISTLQRNLGEASPETDKAAVAIKRLGLNLNELRNASPERLLELVSKALAEVPNRSQRAADGAALLGKQFRELFPSIEATAGRLAEFKKQGMRPEDIKRLDQFGDAITKLSNSLQILASIPLANIAKLIAVLTGTAGPDVGLKAELSRIDAQALKLDADLQRLSKATDPFFEKQRAVINAQRQALGVRRLAIENQLKGLEPAAAPAVAPFKEPPKKVVPDTRTEQLVKEGIKDISAAIDEMQETAIKGGQAIIDISETLDREGLTPLDEKLADINKKFDELRQKAAAAEDATGQDVSGIDRRITRLRDLALFQARQADLATKTSALDVLDESEGERFRNQRQQLLDLGKATAEFQDRMREIAALSKVFGSSFDAVGASVSAVRSEIERLIATGLNPLDPKITELKGKLDDFQSAARNADAAEALIRGAAGGITGSLQGVIQGTQSVSDAFRNMGQSILLSISNIIFQLLVLEPIIKSVRASLEGGGFLAGLFGGGGSGPLDVNAPVTIGEFPKIPFLQGGGIIRRQTLAMVHPDEAVIPLPRKDMLGGQSNVNITINGDIIPRQQGMTRDEVIKVISDDFNHRGQALQTAEQRLSLRR